ncbi:MAG: DUF1501 domain-containing protein [Janthinobacterium lividum]
MNASFFASACACNSTSHGRRVLLKAMAGLPLAGAAGTLFAAPAVQSKLLVVFLRGAYDAASLLVPLGSRFYQEVRPNIAIAQPSADPGSAMTLDADWGLHPVLRQSILPLYSAGQVAFIPFAGTNDSSRSHFETQDHIELGQADGVRSASQSGFLNRLANELNGHGAIAFTDKLPLIMQGSAQIPNTGLRNVGRQTIDARQSSIIAAMYGNTALAHPVNDGFAVRDEVQREVRSETGSGTNSKMNSESSSEKRSASSSVPRGADMLNAEMVAASRNAISAKGFELEARRIARLMKDHYNIGFVDVGGWDTHVGQGAANGYLAGRFEELGRGLAGFSSEMGSQWRDTVVVVVSEFGRTFRENGNRGTDHGHGSVYWVLGGAVKGGRIAGEQVRVEQASLFQNRDYPVLTEYRALFGGLFARLYGLNAVQLARIFPGAAPRDLGLV